MENKVYITHFVYIPFVGVGVNNPDDAWFQRRIDIFKHYTLKSLQNQSAKEFILWLSFRPQERDNPLTRELADHIRSTGIKFVMTFDGLMYHDDKFSKGIISRIMNIGRVLRQFWRSGSVQWASLKELLHDKNATLLQRVSKSLQMLVSLGNMNLIQWVYLTRIDSDDMFHKDAIKDIQSKNPFQGALTFKKGYVYDTNTNKMAEWLPTTNPPFHTIIFPSQEFFDPARYLQYYRTFQSHEDIPKVFVCEQLPDFRYCVVIHNVHISTQFLHPYKGCDIIDEQKKKELLGDFGICYENASSVKKFSM